MLVDQIPQTKYLSGLFEKMQQINPGLKELEFYEFCYGLNTMQPEDGWQSVRLDTMTEIEKLVNSRGYYDSIQIKPIAQGLIVLDEQVQHMTQMLLSGIACDAYPVEWVRQHFYFDIRGFFFLHRTQYFTEKILAHFGGKPYCQFEQKQIVFEAWQDLGYKAFKTANAEVDGLFIKACFDLIEARGEPVVLAIAGATAAGKTEIVERLSEAFRAAGKKVTSVELDNFLTDRDEREIKGIFSQGKEALHFGLFCQSLEDICTGKQIIIPRYDFFDGSSSHRLDGTLKPGREPITIDPADIIFIEGNFPFLIEEVKHLIGIKVVYLTDDPVRLLRKWKRDIDLRKKYEPTYFRNRWYKDQFIMAEIAYRPQLEVCDICVDTTGAALWVTPEVERILNLSAK